jgi:Lipocalin-like domain
MTTPMTGPSPPTSPPPTADRLVGTWRLVSYQDVDEDGTTSDGPLGPAPAGLLHYLADGYMAVSMMRTGEDRPGERDPGRQHETFMGYAGRWELADGRVVHRAEVSAHPFQIGIDQVREVVLDGDELTLVGHRPNSDRPQRRMLRWRRADHQGGPTR